MLQLIVGIVVKEIMMNLPRLLCVWSFYYSNSVLLSNNFDS